MNTPALESAGRIGKSTIGSLSDMADRTLDGLQRMTQLNVQTVKTTLAEQKEIADEVLATRSLDWVLTLPSAQSQAALKKALAYWGHASNIAIETVADNVGCSWSSLNDYSRWAASLLDDASELARAGADTSASTSLVVTDPDAQLPATVESTEAASVKTGGKGRSVNLVDSEGKSVSSTKR
ncbi:TIGR01841 family phasin [Paraburkholderia sp. NMBU_R16]|uniref:TIGR01841 family phasin n=1 Tax=Paraburkholderia sp. NMBU_R16 TaxID=2698676 RepID=UPI001564E5E2|nr:TIGR01841 family phasin [Paraburkholderia sp. NMBU_R16]NRO94696.1 TIGR01841 family phasin [Paraburkholderia sp. NMBU_R16]